MTEGILDIDVKEKLKEMSNITQEILDKISYACSKMPNDEIYYLSFNGGKDCLAAYIVLKYFLYCRKNNLSFSQLDSYESFVVSDFITDNVVVFYFINDKYFEMEEDYVISFIKKEKLKVHYCYSSYSSGLHFLMKEYPITTIVMGTRFDDIKNASDANDIKTSLTQNSTKPFPEFVRIYPIFNFTYSEVWRLILSSKVEYLKLYDKGFSSIGDRFNTKINSHLYVNERKALPAWVLKEIETEREYR